jgi:hypothetical protein
MKKYEYTHRFCRNALLTYENLNEYGNQGWELTSIIKTKEIEFKRMVATYHYYFKREVIQDEKV